MLPHFEGQVKKDSCIEDNGKEQPETEENIPDEKVTHRQQSVSKKGFSGGTFQTKGQFT